MKKSPYKEEQIIAVLKEVDAGGKLQDVIRRLGISEQTYYRWKAKHGEWRPATRRTCERSRTRIHG